MGKILVIAEKPSVARDIAKVLKCNKKSRGYLYNDKYIVSWAIGHLVELWEPEDYSGSLKKWNFSELPIIPENIKIKPVNKTRDQYNILKGLMESEEVTSFICATDSGREGELIFRYIYESVGSEKPFQRLWISSMTDKAIKDGFDKLKDGSEYDNLYYSAKCRSEADWLVGINATRAYTLKYGVLLSLGRVQTPTLAILVERQKEIDAFTPQDYWEIDGNFGEYIGKWFGETDTDTKIFDKEKALDILSKIKDKKGNVTSIENEEKKKAPPLLYDLTALQREGNRKFGFSAKKTLTVAQSLYEKRKLITYPRTDSRYLSKDMIGTIKTVIKKLSGEDDYKVFADYILSLKKLPITKRIINDSKVTDHHAIIPTEKKANLNQLSSDELKIYDLITKRFLAVFYPHYIYNVTKIITVVEEENFLTRGNTIVQMGYREIYGKDGDEDKEDEAVLPNVAVGDEVTLVEALIEQKKTRPPNNYTEATLLSAMENAGRFVDDEELKDKLKESGLGTPATRASIIERLIKVNYMTRKGKSLIPTEKAMKLLEIVPPEMSSPETTGRWEKGLSSISKGKMEPERFMGSIGRYVNYIVAESAKMNKNIVFENEGGKKYSSKKNSLGDCPLCGSGVYENSKAFFCGSWRKGCKFNIWKNSLEQYGVTLDKEIAKALLKDRKIENVKLVLPQTGEKSIAQLTLTETGKVEFKNLERMKE